MRKTHVIIMLICGMIGLWAPRGMGAQTLTVVFEEWPPYQFTSDGKVIGTDTDVLEEAGRRLGLTF